MASADQISGSVNIQKVQDDVVKLWNVVKSQPEISEEQKNRIKALYDGVVRSLRKSPDSCLHPGVPRSHCSLSQFLRPQVSSITSVSADKIPLLHLKRRMGTQWENSSNLTGVYFNVLHKIAMSSTVRRCSCRRHDFPLQPCHSRILPGSFPAFRQPWFCSYCHSFQPRLLYIAAVPENGREIDSLDDKSELTHHIMLVNLLHHLGAIKTKKTSHQIVAHLTQVVLPSSPL